VEEAEPKVEVTQPNFKVAYFHFDCSKGIVPCCGRPLSIILSLVIRVEFSPSGISIPLAIFYHYISVFQDLIEYLKSR